MIKRPCRVCGTVITVESLKHDMCGPACAELSRRRAHYAAAGVKPGHPEYTPHTTEQRSLHRAGLRKED